MLRQEESKQSGQSVGSAMTVRLQPDSRGDGNAGESNGGRGGTNGVSPETLLFI